MGRGVQVTRSRRLDRGWQQVSVMMSAPDGSLLVTVVFTYPRGTVPSQADATCGGVAFDVLGAPGSFDPDPLPAIVDGFLQQLGCAGP